MNTAQPVQVRAAVVTLSKLLTVGLVYVCIAAGSTWRAEAADSGKSAVLKRAPDRQAKVAATSNGNSRYAYHNGQWWYWLPSNSWAFYDGQHWVAYRDTNSSSSAQHTRVGRSGASQVRYSYNRPTGSDADRYEAGQAPSAPPGSLEELQQDLAQTKQSVRQLEARVRAQEQARRGLAPFTASQAAALSELWQLRQADIKFYDFGTDEYYEHGRGHFVD